MCKELENTNLRNSGISSRIGRDSGWRKRGPVDLSGLRFGKLVVLKLAGRHPTTNRFTWLCRCDCGNEKEVVGNAITGNNKTKSCGCDRYSQETNTSRSAALEVHGMSTDRHYNTWLGMMSRCYREKDTNYAKYGGRGIKMCRRIKESPKNLLEFMGEKPPGMSIDRIDNDGNYSCGSCDECAMNGWPRNMRWATPVQQVRNTRRNRIVEIDGVSRCVSEWAEIGQMKPETFCSRLRAGVKGSALLLPVRKHKWHPRPDRHGIPFGSKSIT